MCSHNGCTLNPGCVSVSGSTSTASSRVQGGVFELSMILESATVLAVHPVENRTLMQGVGEEVVSFS